MLPKIDLPGSSPIRADLAGTRPLTPVAPATRSAPIGDARQEVFNRLGQIALGKTLQADVLSRLDNNMFMVRIANTAMRASLPQGAQVGDTLNIKMVAAQPRPTFLLLSGADADTTSLSNAGRLIDKLLQTQGSASTALTGNAALLSRGITGSTEIAAALRNTLAFSGLFYESHLKQWISGERPLAQLKHEPQSLLHAQQARLAAAGGGAASGNALAQMVDVVSEWSDARPAQAAGAMPQAGQTAMETADSRLMQLVNLQLQTLENNRVAWHGELWPGQRLEWEVSEDHPQDGEAEGEDQPTTWTSVVRFELPTLGTIAATIHLSGEHVTMQIRTARDHAAAALRTHGGELASALEAAGAPLDGLTVDHDDNA